MHEARTRGRKGRSILHVDDDPIDIENVRRAFVASDLERRLVPALDGEEALARLQGEPREHPDLILIDLSMPRMDGFELLESLKQDPDLRRIPAVVLTASNREEDRRRAYDLGAAGYVVKPMAFDGMVEAIRAIDQYWSLCESP